jgi:tRNA G10  N-methylase Trm11
MMINLALHSGSFSREDRICLLDPVAGKGTTLFEGLRLGLDVAGIEIGGKAVQEMNAYFKKYLETEKYKHTFAKERKSGANKAFTAHLYSYAFAKTKEDFHDPQRVQHLTMAEGNARYAAELFPKGAFQLLVGDLPYGVAHGNVTGEKASSLTRNPTELLEACLPAWRTVLASDGVMVLAWNLHVLPRERMLDILRRNGFVPFTGGPYDRLAHRVDRSIQRDVVVAGKRRMQ